MPKMEVKKIMKKVTKVLSAALVFSLSFSTLFNSSNVSTKAATTYSLNNSTYFKDANFRKLLKERADSNKDGFLSENEIKNYTILEIWGDSRAAYEKDQITNLSGIEYLTNLEFVIFNDTSLESVDFSKNKKLTNYMIFSSQMLKSATFSSAATSVEISNCSSLKNVDLTSSTELTKLTIGETNIRNLNLTSNNKIVNLETYGTPIETISFSSNSQLESLHTSGSKIKNIDLTNCKKLTSLHVENKKENYLSSFKVNTNVIEDLLFDYANFSSFNLNNYPKLISLTIKNDENFNDFTYGYKTTLKTLAFDKTSVRAVDISNFPNLTNLAFVSTPIKHIDLPSCKKLKVVDVRDTRAGKLVIGNGTELASLLRTRKCTLHEADDYEYFTWADDNAQKYFTYESNICIYNY